MEFKSHSDVQSLISFSKFVFSLCKIIIDQNNIEESLLLWSLYFKIRVKICYVFSKFKIMFHTKRSRGLFCVCDPV